MRYLSMYRDVTFAVSGDGVSIGANYVDHPVFDFSNRLSCGLNYVFHSYTVTCSYSRGYELRTAIAAFLDYVGLHNSRSGESLKVLAIEDIGVEEFRQFESHLQREQKSTNLARRLKAALTKVASLNDDGLPLLKLPIIKLPKDKPREPLDQETDSAFYDFMHKEVDRLRAKLEAAQSAL